MLFNNIDLTSYLRIKQIKGRGNLSRQIGLMSLSGSDGALYQRKRRPHRELEIEADVRADDDLNLLKKMDKLNGILNVSEPVPIIFPDEPDKTYYGIPALSEGSNEVYFLFKGHLLIICPDPDKYGIEQEKVFNNGVLTLSNNGTVETRPVLEIVMSAPSSDLIISNGDKSLRLIFGFIAGDIIQIDFKKRKVLLNNVVKMTIVDLNNPHFFPLARGSNTLTIVPSNDATLTYKEAWE